MDTIKKQAKNVNLTKKENISEIIMKYGTLGGFIVLIIIFTILSPVFFTISNLINILHRVSTLGIVSMGICCVMITGSIDLSFAGTVSAAGVVAPYLISIGVNIWIAFICALLLGCLIGSINAFNIFKLGIPDFIATIAMISVLNGLVFWITRGFVIWKGLDNNFFYIGQATLGYLPVSSILMIILAILYTFVTFRTKISRYIYAIGDNTVSAKYSGIDVDKIKSFMFVLCGLNAAMVGLVQASKVGQGRPGLGSGLLLDSLAAVFLSMTMFRKGEPHIPGTILGALLIAVLDNGMTLLNVTYYYRDIIIGIVIIGVVIIATNKRKRLQGG